METYSVLLDGRTVGKAYLEKNGMFYDIRCICRVSGNLKYDAYIQTPSKKISLGLCVPTQRGIEARKRIPARVLDSRDVKIGLSRRVERKLCFEIDPEKPFPMLKEIKNARIVADTETGECNIIVPKL